MQDFTLQHANTFFFITTIAVGILIVILLAFLYLTYKVIRFARKSMDRVDGVLDQVSERTEVHPIYKKSLPYILPIVGYLFGRKAKSSRASKHIKKD